MKLPIDIDLKIDQKGINSINKIFNAFLSELKSNVSTIKDASMTGKDPNATLKDIKTSIDNSSSGLTNTLQDILSNMKKAPIPPAGPSPLGVSPKAPIPPAGPSPLGVSPKAPIPPAGGMPPISPFSPITAPYNLLESTLKDFASATQDALQDILGSIKDKPIDIENVMDFKEEMISKYEKYAERIKDVDEATYKSMQQDIDRIQNIIIDPTASEAELKKVRNEILKSKDVLARVYMKKIHVVEKRERSQISKKYKELEEWSDKATSNLLSLPIVDDITQPFKSFNDRVVKRLNIDLGAIAKSPFRFGSGFGSGFQDIMSNKPKGAGLKEQFNFFAKAVSSGVTSGAKSAGLLGVGTKVFLVGVIGVALYTFWKMYVEPATSGPLKIIGDTIKSVYNAIADLLRLQKQANMAGAVDKATKIQKLVEEGKLTPEQQRSWGASAVQMAAPYKEHAPQAQEFIMKNFGFLDAKTQANIYDEWIENFAEMSRADIGKDFALDFGLTRSAREGLSKYQFRQKVMGQEVTEMALESSPELQKIEDIRQGYVIPIVDKSLTEKEMFLKDQAVLEKILQETKYGNEDTKALVSLLYDANKINLDIKETEEKHLDYTKMKDSELSRNKIEGIGTQAASAMTASRKSEFLNDMPQENNSKTEGR